MDNISLQKVLNLSKEDFFNLFEKEGGSISIAPPTQYKINWDKVTTIEDVKQTVKLLYKALHVDNTLLIKEGADENREHFLDIVE